MTVLPDAAGMSAAITLHQFFTIMSPLGLILFLIFVAEELAGRAEEEAWREKKIVAWVDRNLAACRVAGLALVVGFYAYQTAWWYNMDMSELNTIAAEGAQVGKEYQRRADLVQNLDNIVNNYASHERVLFEHVSDMRSQLKALEMAGGAPSASQSAKIEQAFMSLTALAEQYPELKAEQRFHELMDMVEINEDRVAERMEIYLEAVLEYNSCNQCYWCNYWTYLIAPFVPLPAYWEYYYSDSKYAPIVPAEDAAAPTPLNGEPVSI